MDLGLAGKKVIMNGGAHGLGLASLKLFAAEGADVAFFSRKDDKIEAAKAEIDAAGPGKVFAEVTQGLIPLDAMSVDVAPTGAMRISGRVGDAVMLNRGANTLVVAVGQSGELPDAAELYRRLDQSGDSSLEIQGSDWQAWRIRLALVTVP